MKSDVYLFFGASGVGKGTQVKLLKEYIENKINDEILTLDMGATLRATIEKGGYAGKKIDSIISQGNFLPSTVPVYFMYDFLMKNFTPDKFLIADGVVRSEVQARAFHEAMYFFEHEDYKIIFIKLSDEEITRRLLKRGRDDDTEEGIKNRIKLYKEQVFPLLDLFNKWGKDIIEIDGSPSIDEVQKDILSKLKI